MEDERLPEQVFLRRAGTGAAFAGRPEEALQRFSKSDPQEMPHELKRSRAACSGASHVEANVSTRLWQARARQKRSHILAKTQKK